MSHGLMPRANIIKRISLIDVDIRNSCASFQPKTFAQKGASGHFRCFRVRHQCPAMMHPAHSPQLTAGALFITAVHVEKLPHKERSPGSFPGVESVLGIATTPGMANVLNQA